MAPLAPAGPPAAPARIALVITGLAPDGAERNLTRLAIGLDRRRFSPVVYSLSPPPPRPLLVEALRDAGVETRFLGARRRAGLPLVVARLAGWFRRDPPSLVQTSLFHANLVGRLAARAAGVGPVVSGIRVAEREKRWHRWLERATHRLAQRHVCVSDDVARFAREVGRLPAERLVVIPNGIDVADCSVDPVALATLGGPPGRRAVACVGRLTAQKRIDWLLRLSPRWMEAAPDCDLLIVGEGPRRAALERVAREAGIADRVHFLGWRGDVPAILAACELLVLPSAWEGLPGVVLEAMAAGRPVVATDVEGVRQLLGDADQERGPSGLEGYPQVTPADDADGFARRIADLLGNSQLAKKLGDENRRRVEAHFSVRRVVAAYETLYESLLAGGGEKKLSSSSGTPHRPNPSRGR